ncbi:NAD(P)-binding protein [Polyplosphaeria fusca]|uniref:NAD(P)-binding protein n=1 Tax=Polyplosphaeria fusca TaxID=682080 RepID=A0A9P4UVS5_9PLEO|nr:NAD(P)-binding protein [Polyplosphaeria fusca]
MVVVAVVGGTGSVGKTLVDAFKEDGQHEVVVLARKVPEGESKAPVIAVDYNNVEQLTKTMAENHVHTVISALVMYDPTAAQAELNLVAAAAASSATKRFVASNWGNASPDDEVFTHIKLTRSLRLPFNTSREQTLEALRKTDLEWTQIHVGLFLDYYGMPHIETYLSPLVFAVDIGNETAAIPGATGDETITLTYTKDMGKFVVAALSLPKWEQALHCYSDNITLKQLVQTAEEVTGSKFNVTYDSVEKLSRNEVTELPSHPYLYKFIPKPMLVGFLAIFGLWAVKGVMYCPKEGSLNEKFPDIATASVKDIVGAWKGK